MKHKKKQSLNERKNGLIDLVKDSQEMGFNPSLISNYKNQLAGVLAGLAAEKNQIDKLRGSHD